MEPPPIPTAGATAVFSAILSRVGQTPESHDVVVVEFCGALADGGSRYYSLHSQELLFLFFPALHACAWFSPLVVLLVNTPFLTPRLFFFACLAVRRAPRWRPSRVP